MNNFKVSDYDYIDFLIGTQRGPLSWKSMKIMLPACAKKGGKNQSRIHLCNYLGFLSMAFLFAAAMPPLSCCWQMPVIKA